jgi:hypothetical protein
VIPSVPQTGKPSFPKVRLENLCIEIAELGNKKGQLQKRITFLSVLQLSFVFSTPKDVSFLGTKNPVGLGQNYTLEVSNFLILYHSLFSRVLTFSIHSSKKKNLSFLISWQTYQTNGLWR